MNKYLYITLFVVILAIVIYAGINEGNINHFDNGKISFDYPENWELQPVSNPSQVALFQPNTDLNVSVNKQVVPAGYQSPENFILNSTEAYNSGFRLLSHREIYFNMDKAYENVYYINSEGNIYLRKEIWLLKNGNLYSIIYNYQISFITPLPTGNISQKEIIDLNPNEVVKTSNTNKVEFIDFKSALPESNTNQGYEIIKQNFKVKSVLIPANTPFWGDMSIPSLNLDWGIRQDTVNGYNSVYHYNESFYPWQKGTVGLLGHHTAYSAPFAKIDQLKTGDAVIINDYLTQKKYIYQVVSNGDIKWDYKINPIKFTEGINELTLVTCYPPGTTQAAWMVHCKLISIEPL